MTVGAPTLFPFAPDAGGGRVLLSRGWLTDVQRTMTGREVRAAERSVVARRMEYVVTLGDSLALYAWRLAWLTATEALRYDVGIWPDWTIPTAVPDTSTVTADTTNRSFVAGRKALLWTSDSDNELITLATVTATGITASSPFASRWTTVDPARIRLVPVMTAWLQPPSHVQLHSVPEQLQVQFDEEPPGVAGLDSTAGAPVTPTPVSLSIELISAGDGWAGQKYFTLQVHVFDASGVEIQDADLAWTITATGLLPLSDPSVHYAFPDNGRQAYIEWIGDADSQFKFHVTAGGLLGTDYYVSA